MLKGFLFSPLQKIQNFACVLGTFLSKPRKVSKQTKKDELQ